MPPGPYRRKLIEVDLPLNDINGESASEKHHNHSHPSVLHRWWARRPLASCRAVLFASLVDDPIDLIDEFPTLEKQHQERTRLHNIIVALCHWNDIDQRHSDGIKLIDNARLEIAKSLARSRNEPAPTEPKDVLEYLSNESSGISIYDPFCGGGSIPLEAQRMGLNAIGSDLNPVAVLITKAMVELPVQFQDCAPINPGSQSPRAGRTRTSQALPVDTWRGYAGLADDIRYYGSQVRELVQEKIGQLYPEIRLDDGTTAAVVAWLWANTVPCSNPACDFDMPLFKNAQLSTRSRNRRWVLSVPNYATNRIEFKVVNDPSLIRYNATVANGQATCVACDTAVNLDYIRNQARAGKMRQQLMVISAVGERGREFVAADEYQEHVAQQTVPPRRPSGSLPLKARSISIQGYGITEWHQLFTDRQLTMLCAFSDSVAEVANEVTNDGGSEDYAKAIHTYLALAVGRLADASNRASTWLKNREYVNGAFSRQSLGMVWDFPESNPLCDVSRNWTSGVERLAKVVERLPMYASPGTVFQADAADVEYQPNGPVIVTDPPYYDNVGYADISDFFYIWHRDMLSEVHPELYLGVQTPKAAEIVAGPGFEKPKERFEGLMSKVLQRIRSSCTNDYPSSIFYAYKQKEEDKGGISSTGWETFLSAVNNAGFRIVGTWPMRTEMGAKPGAQHSNMLASSVVLVTRPRELDAPTATRQQFVTELEATLPEEINRLTLDGHIAPIDLAQAVIGPGMEVYTKYARVQTIAGEPVSVKDALKEVNRVVGEHFRRQQGDLDAETSFCLDWLRAHDFNEGPFGDAETLAKAKDIAVNSLRDDEAVLKASGNKVRLTPWYDYGEISDLPEVGPSTTAWSGLMRIAWHFHEGRGVEAGGKVIRAMTGTADQVERLSYILFDHYDRKFKPNESRIFNNIAYAWEEIMEQARFEQQLTNQ